MNSILTFLKRFKKIDANYEKNTKKKGHLKYLFLMSLLTSKFLFFKKKYHKEYIFTSF